MIDRIQITLATGSVHSVAMEPPPAGDTDELAYLTRMPDWIKTLGETADTRPLWVQRSGIVSARFVETSLFGP